MAKEIEKTQEAGQIAAYDYGEDTGAGFDNTSREDYKVPFLAIAQKGNPQVNKQKSEYIEGLEVGMFFNTVTEEFFPEGVVFVPAHREHLYVEWKPDRGGLVGQHLPEDEIVRKAKTSATEFGKYQTSDGNDLVETFYLWGVYVDSEGDPQPALMAFTSTQIKHYKAFMTRARAIRVPTPDGRKIEPPLFAHRWRFTTRYEENEYGDWYGNRIEFDGKNAAESRLSPEDPVYQAARSIRELAKTGAYVADTESMEKAQSTDETGEPAPEGAYDETGEPAF